MTVPAAARRGLLVAGRATTALALLACVGMQLVSGDWLPPDVSFSQYGVGAHGWIFSVFLLSLGAAGVCWGLLGPVSRWSVLLAAVGAFGCLVDAVIPTDAGGLQQSWHAKVHMSGSVLILVCLPLALRVALGACPPAARRAGTVLCVISGASLALLLAAAFGIDSAGVGLEASWAWWQTVAVVADLVLLVLVAVILGTISRQAPAGDAAGRLNR